MVLLDTEVTASQVLRVFHRDELFLFLGSAFSTVGLVIWAFLIIRRRFEALLFWLALFAILYGQRLWMRSELLAMVIPSSTFFIRLKVIVDFVVALPAFFFFEATGFLRKPGKILTVAACVILLGITVAGILGAPLAPLSRINNIVVICALLVLVIELLRNPIREKDFIVARNGLLIFAGFALWNNLGGVLGYKSEPYGFGIFLGCLGYVAARRAIQRDQQFSALQKELEVAKRIQLSILPPEFPASPYFRVAARYIPMTSVAGDFYDFLEARDGKAGLLIADVSGHGVPAALIASMVKVAANSQREHTGHPEKLLAGMNATLCGNTQSQFVTAAYVHLDAHTGKLSYAAAAHLPMLVLREGKVASVEENGLMLALFSSATYTSTTQQLKDGDRLLLYTDGIVEAESASTEQFGHERLCELLQESAKLTPDETVDLILARINAWSPSQDDDRTVLVCDYVANA
ncbi:SpoIIE family protein phosphatase [Alloacidobacterium dinghuense]|uniref:SpoIIE family protein phosphatase n=1 Tax=Alloacidobacterium dinghuense TaxID=2763107 RepID=A0A7G8BQL4_9BACT|nr:PP2C family protein-serine/threonine phosphatase [Alloacidobacterium dinghuense]QNI34834.1 SpoIIE family protein phosphatase [Alloacidobacterium dinghuense]